MNMLLDGKNAVIYGGGGAVGGAVAKAFAREGANVFLAGRSIDKLNAVVEHILASGGVAEAAVVDALDKESIENHLSGVVRKAGGLDISFNAIDLGDAQGAPLVEMTQEHFMLPIGNAMKTQFLTATGAARHMAEKRSGVILAITAQAGRKPYPNTGGFGVACAAMEGLCRQFAAELGPQGIRVICLRSSGSPDAPGVQAAMRKHAENAGISLGAMEERIAENTLLKRMPRLADVANAAVLMASNHANAITGAVANVTCGEIVD
jgi:NAD(P)-dependent dehydrogenase (short-subunit alcohol dehydrogenase family)